MPAVSGSRTDGPCAHVGAVPVESGGEVVAGLCPDCDRQLTARWFTCAHASTADIPRLGDRWLTVICLNCSSQWTEEW